MIIGAKVRIIIENNDIRQEKIDEYQDIILFITIFFVILQKIIDIDTLPKI